MSVNQAGKKIMGVSAACLAALLMALFAFAPSADAQKLGNPSPPNFRAQVTGGFIQIIGSGTPLQLSLDFSQFDPPLANPTFEGTITRDANGFGVINVPRDNVRFAPIPINVDGIAVIVRIQPAADATGRIDPLTGRVDLRVPLKFKADGSPLGISLGNNCFIGSDGNPVVLNTTTHYGTFPSTTSSGPNGTGTYVASFAPDGSGFLGGLLPAGPYSDEAGNWPLEPKLGGIGYEFVPRNAGSWRGQDETFAAPAATNCGIATDTLNGLIGLPTLAGNSTASLDFEFIEIPGVRTGPDAIVQKGVKSSFFSPEVASPQWPQVQRPTIVSGQTISVDASPSRFNAGPHPTERYRFDFGSGFGPWTTNPVTTYTGPVIPNGTQQTVTVRVQVKDADGDTDTNTRELRLLPATDIRLTAEASSVAGPRLRAGSSGTVRLDVRNSSTTDNSSLPIRLQASLPSGVTLTNLGVPNSNWNCSSTSSSIDCLLPPALLAPNGTNTFQLAVDVAPTAPAPAAIPVSAVMVGDPDTSNDRFTFDPPVAKTDLDLTLTRTAPLVANGWTPYEVDVANLGDASTVGGSVVTISLPEGFSYRAAGSITTGWSCATPSGPREVVCSRSTEIGAGSAAPKITVVARIDRSTPAAPRTVSASVVTQADVDAFGGQNTDADTSDVAVLPDLASDISVTGDYKVGDPASATISVANESVVPIDGTTRVTSPLPGGVTINAVSGTGWDCSATVLGSSTVDCERSDTIDAGTTPPPLNLTFDVAQAAFPGVELSVVVDNLNDGFDGNDGDAATVRVRRLNVAIEKIAVRPFNVGVEGRYRLNVTNVGDATTVGTVTVTDQLPEGLELRSASGGGWDCSASSTVSDFVECDLSSALEAGIQAAPIDIRVDVLDRAAEIGLLENTGFVDTPRDERSNPNDAAITGNNSSTIQTAATAVDLAITSVHPGDFLVGTQDVYSLDIVNVGAFGTDPGEPVTVTDDIPTGMVPLIDQIETSRAGWDCVADAGDVVCTLPAPSPSTSAMPANSTATIDIPVLVTDDAADNSVNVAEVSTSRDSNPALSPNNRSTDPTNVKRIDIAVAAQQTIAPRAGGIGEVGVAVENIGSAATTAPTTVVVPLAANTSYRVSGSTTTGWNCSSPGAGTQVSCTRTSSIPSGGQAPPLRVRSNISPQAAGQWTTNVSASTNGEPPQRLANNSSSVNQTLEVVDLTISKVHDPANAIAGKRSGFAISVENVGNTPSSGTIRVEDTINSAFSDQGVTASGSGWSCTVTGRSISCTRAASLAAGATAPPVNVNFNIPSSSFGIRDSIARVTNVGDPYPANDTASDPITIIIGPDLAVEIDQPQTMRVGDVVPVSYRVTNIGGEPTSSSPSATLAIDLDSNLAAVEATSTEGWDCTPRPLADPTPGFVCENPGELQPGDSVSLTASVRVGASAAPQAATLARASTPGDLNSSNDIAVAFSSLADLDLAIEVSGNPTTLTAGETGVRDVTVSNLGTTATTSPVRVTVPLPPGIQWDDTTAPGAPWSCSLQTRTITCDTSSVVPAGSALPNLRLGIVASRGNAPGVDIQYFVETEGDENAANNMVELRDPVQFVPETTIDSAPSGTVTTRGATISFSSDDSDAVFECSLDRAPYTACTSPVSLSSLTDGAHIFQVRASNPDNQLVDQTPAEARWSVSPEPPAGEKKRVKATLTGGNLVLPGLADEGAPFEGGQLRLIGDLYENGGFVVPASGVEFDPLVIEQAIPGVGALTATIEISATGQGAGTLTPGGGLASFQLPVKAQVIVATAVPGFSIPREANCFLDGIQFDLNGTWDETAKTVELGSQALSFPAAPVDACGPLAGALNTLAGLPRDDISLSLAFTLEDLPPVDVPSPRLAKPAIKAPKSVKSGKPVTLRATFRNTGDAAATNVRVCFTAKTKSLVRGRTQVCRTVKTIGAGKSVTLSQRFQTKSGKKGKKIRFEVSARYKVPEGQSREYKGHVTLMK